MAVLPTNFFPRFIFLCMAFVIAHLLLTSMSNAPLTIVPITTRMSVRATGGQETASVIPPPEGNKCTIMTCGNQTLPHTQDYSHPSFTHVHLDESQAVRAHGLYPAWCRVAHLENLRQAGHTCVVYTDDDVYLNLDSLSSAIRSATDGSILVASTNNFGNPFNINAGLVVFKNLQARFAHNVINGWVRTMTMHAFQFGLKDQAALNSLISCQMPLVNCFARAEYRDLGLMRHCLSVLNRGQVDGKRNCMRAAKSKVARWDAAAVVSV